MRVFVTGATGYVGSAVVKDLIQAGHQVLGLARSDAAAEALIRIGAEVHKGDLSDIESLAAGARQCEGVLHTAYNHDYSQFVAAGETDRRAVEVLGTALKGTGRPLVITSAIGTFARAPNHRRRRRRSKWSRSRPHPVRGKSIGAGIGGRAV